MSVAHASANAAQGAAHMVLASNVPLEMSCCMLHRVFGVYGPIDNMKVEFLPDKQRCVIVVTYESEAGQWRAGLQGVRLNPLGLFLRTSIPFIWCILSAFLPA